jgi:hypothetical protein
MLPGKGNNPQRPLAKVAGRRIRVPCKDFAMAIQQKNAPAVVLSSAPIPPEDLISIEELVKRLHTDVQWVREKCRRRCPNPIPVWNLGRHLLFDWVQVSDWIRNSPRPVHAHHKRRKKTKDVLQIKKAA